MADDAGALLVRSGLVPSSALDDARLRVMQGGGTVGEALVVAGVISDDTLTDFYRKRLLVPQVNPNTLAKLPPKVIATVPADMAVELRAVPVALDSDNNLTVAMSDPSDRHAVDEIAFFTGAYVVRAVATQMQIAWCLAHYYGHVTPLGERLLKGDESQQQVVTAPQRKKGITDQVKAMRTKRLERGAVMASDIMAELATVEATKVQPVTSDDAPTPVDTPAAKPRSRTASGEIKIPIRQPRAPSIKPPLPDDSGPVVMMEAGEPSGPVVTIEADEPELTIERPSTEDVTEPRKVPKRKRPVAQPDPPELAARAGEVQLATGEAITAIDFDVLPSIMISDELERALRPSMPSIAGELRGREHEDSRPPPVPSISVELDGTESGPAIIRDQILNERSEPVLLERRRASDPPPSAANAAPATEIDPEDEISDVVVLELKKPRLRTDRITQVGIGAVTAATSGRMTTEDVLATDAAPAASLDDTKTDVRRVVPDADTDPTRLDASAAPPRDDDSSDDHLAAPPPPIDGANVRDTLQVPVVPPPRPVAAPPPSGAVSFDNVRPQTGRDEDDDEDDIKTKPTMVMSAHELDALIPDRLSDPLIASKRPAARDTDAAWGPPGTTIPPPLLGAIPGALEPTSGIIPLPNIDSAPLMVTEPAPPESAAAARARTASEQGVARLLEESTVSVLELIRTLEHATQRDQVIAVMIAHLADSHRRAGFLAARNGELSLFALMPRVPTMSTAKLRLDRPSTFQDVVGTRLPYRGPVIDETSSAFLTSLLGACPPELLLVPISVRERVVGVVFGEHRVKHTFDDQLALAGRAAGMALERILKARRG